MAPPKSRSPRAARAALVLAVLAAPVAVTHPASADTVPTAVNPQNWMSGVGGETPLSAMTVPGTHETMAIHGGMFVQTQYDYGDSGATLGHQLDSGIRAIDIRVRVVDGGFTIHHGAYYQNAVFDDVLGQARNFLAAHSSETILLRLHAECGGDTLASPTSCVDQPWKATQAERMAILDRYVEQNKDLFYDKSVVKPTPAEGGLYYYHQAEIPKLSEVRGKIVLTNFEGPGGGDYGYGIKDYKSHLGDLDQPASIEQKWDAVRTHLDEAALSNSGMYVTYTSASTVAHTPDGFANGESRMIGPRERVKIEGVNSKLSGYLGSPDVTKHLGVVMMDFPTGSVIDPLISRNLSLAGPNKPVFHATPPSRYSLENAYSYLAGDLDRYGSGSALRVPQSYRGGYFDDPRFGPDGFQASFTYDNALVVAAFLQRGNSEDIGRATALGDSLLYAQAHDIVPDGRLRASYEPNPFVTASGAPYVGGFSVYTGNMAWAGLTFTRLYHVTGQQRFLDGALKAANWIQANAADSRGAGGYTGGLRNDDETGAEMIPLRWKATEHNIDTGAFFRMLAQVTGDGVWQSRSDNAFAFVRTMQAANGHLWTGTGLDGVTINEDVEPEDVQTWSYLATKDPAYAPAIDWTAGRMAATDGGFSGVSFSGADTSKVWFEGTAHLAAAYRARNAPGDADKATTLLATIAAAQTNAPNNDGRGIVAASSDGLNTGEGDIYYAALHTGATAWYLIAAQGGNPFVL
ncbi:hypothetical protein F4556_000836 [Kitasatospora gansuensis]|uniref:1-phosphatidylinositol phosphodiesterase n=1 Tax=Kitasatospora gansuensis TaxID=258050 RepID=A0A7W7WFK6_9ACTN|nr:phosphatidylinositol-specific phospholipase C domain-containing protein [Kitasatospora gansuensis]MBB4945301.1 hypothetical protein [Kitasatospora gansuensis]